MPPALHNPDKETHSLRRSFYIAVSFAALLWLIKFVELIFGFDLFQYGIYPRRSDGVVGIVWAPLIHGSLSHLFSNTAPIIILGTTLLYGYPRSAKRVIPLVCAGSGIGVWLFARSAYHIGASGLTFGVMFFIFTIGVLRWDRRAITLSLLVFFLYGGMIWGIFPTAPEISFESHLFGAVTGVVLAILFKGEDPAPPEKRYSWEGEEEHYSEEDEWSVPQRERTLPAKPAMPGLGHEPTTPNTDNLRQGES